MAIVTDIETGKLYDVTDPAHPIEINPATGLPYAPVPSPPPAEPPPPPPSQPIPTPPTLVTDPETGNLYDVTDPAHPILITPTSPYPAQPQPSEPVPPQPYPITPPTLVTDPETGNLYDVSNPANPILINPATGQPYPTPSPTEPYPPFSPVPVNIVTDQDTGKIYDMTDPTRPVEVNITKLQYQQNILPMAQELNLIRDPATYSQSEIENLFIKGAKPQELVFAGADIDVVNKAVDSINQKIEEQRKALESIGTTIIKDKEAPDIVGFITKNLTWDNRLDFKAKETLVKAGYKSGDVDRLAETIGETKSQKDAIQRVLDGIVSKLDNIPSFKAWNETQDRGAWMDYRASGGMMPPDRWALSGRPVDATVIVGKIGLPEDIDGLALERAINTLGIKVDKYGSDIQTWNLLSKEDKYRVADLYNQDLYKANSFASIVKSLEDLAINSTQQYALGQLQSIPNVYDKETGKYNLSVAKESAKDYGIDNDVMIRAGFSQSDIDSGKSLEAKGQYITALRGMVIAPILLPALPIAKASIGEKVTPQEIALGAATAAADVLSLGGAGLLAGLGSLGAKVGAASGVAIGGTFLGTSLADQIPNWATMTPTERRIAIGMDALMAVGVVAGAKALKGSTKTEGNTDAMSKVAIDVVKQASEPSGVPVSIPVKIGETISNVKTFIKDVPNRVMTAPDAVKYYVDDLKLNMGQVSKIIERGLLETTPEIANKIATGLKGLEWEAKQRIMTTPEAIAYYTKDLGIKAEKLVDLSKSGLLEVTPEMAQKIATQLKGLEFVASNKIMSIPEAVSYYTKELGLKVEELSPISERGLLEVTPELAQRIVTNLKGAKFDITKRIMTIPEAINYYVTDLGIKTEQLGELAVKGLLEVTPEIARKVATQLKEIKYDVQRGILTLPDAISYYSKELGLKAEDIIELVKKDLPTITKEQAEKIATQIKGEISESRIRFANIPDAIEYYTKEGLTKLDALALTTRVDGLLNDIYKAMKAKDLETLRAKAKMLESLTDKMEDRPVADTLKAKAQELQKNADKYVEVSDKLKDKDAEFINKGLDENSASLKNIYDKLKQTRKLEKEDIGKITREGIVAKEVIDIGSKDYLAELRRQDNIKKLESKLGEATSQDIQTYLDAQTARSENIPKLEKTAKELTMQDIQTYLDSLKVKAKNLEQLDKTITQEIIDDLDTFLKARATLGKGELILEEGTIPYKPLDSIQQSLVDSINYDTLKLTQYRNIKGMELESIRIFNRIQENMAKLAELRGKDNPIIGFMDALDAKLKELGYSNKEILEMAGREKLEKVSGGIPPERITRELEEKLYPTEKGGATKVATKEKTEVKPKKAEELEKDLLKEETKKEVKPETKPEIKIEEKPKTETKTEVKPREAPPERPFSIPLYKPETGVGIPQIISYPFSPEEYPEKAREFEKRLVETVPLKMPLPLEQDQQEAYDKRVEELSRIMTIEQAKKIADEEFGKIKPSPVISPRPVPYPMPRPLPQPSPQPQPQPTPQPQPQPTPQPVPLPEPTPIPTPVPEPEPVPVPEPMPTPTPEPQPEPEEIKIPSPQKTKFRLYPPYYVFPEVPSGEKQIVKLPYGALTWRQGNHWGYITKEELAKADIHKEIIWLKEGEIPEGIYKYAEGKGSARKTLQILPKGAILENDADVDMGWALVHISKQNGDLTMSFEGGKEAAEDRWREEKAIEESIKYGTYPLLAPQEKPTPEETNADYQGLFMRLVMMANDRGYKIRYVNYNQLRDYAAMHPLVAKDLGYEMPDDEIHLNEKWNETFKDRYENLKHELEEMEDMQGGQKYFPAHVEALDSEKDTDLKNVRMPKPNGNYDEYINGVIEKAREKNRAKLDRAYERRLQRQVEREDELGKEDENNLVYVPEHFRRKKIAESSNNKENVNISLPTKKYMGRSLRSSSVGLGV